MTRRDLDAAIAALARRQHGAFSRAQALALGFSDRMIHHRITSARWLRLEGGVYALPGNPSTWRRQCMAATLAVAGSALSGRPAAALHGFDGFHPVRPEITVPRGSSHHTDLARVRQSNLVEITAVDRIPVVTPAQTVVDLARTHDVDRLRAVVGDVVAADPSQLAAIQDRYVALARSRQGGIGRLRSVLEQLGDGPVPTGTQLERALVGVLLSVPGMPPWTTQARLPWRPDAPQRVDVLIPHARTIVEADGRRWHSRVDDFERDRERDNDAALHGHHTLRYTWRRLTHDRDAVIADLATLARDAAAA